MTGSSDSVMWLGDCRVSRGSYAALQHNPQQHHGQTMAWQQQRNPTGPTQQAATPWRQAQLV